MITGATPAVAAMDVTRRGSVEAMTATDVDVVVARDVCGARIEAS